MSMFNFSSNPIKDWQSDQNWILMDATSKGFFTQLLLLSSQTKPYGYLSNDEKKIKRLLGLPNKTFTENDYIDFNSDKNDINKSLKKYFEENSTRFNISNGMLEAIESIWTEDEQPNIKEIRKNYDCWLNFLWETKWKPEIMNMIMVVDAEITLDFPELSDKIGGFFIPLGYHLGNFTNNPKYLFNSETKKEKKIVQKKKKELEIIKEEDFYFELDNDQELSLSGLMSLENNIFDLFTFDKLYKCFVQPLTEQQKNTIWDLGISLLNESGTEKENKKARALMAKAMKEFGKDYTIEAITALSLVKDKPLNPQAFFFKVLQNKKSDDDFAKSKIANRINEDNNLTFL